MLQTIGNVHKLTFFHSFCFSLVRVSLVCYMSVIVACGGDKRINCVDIIDAEINEE